MKAANDLNDKISRSSNRNTEKVLGKSHNLGNAPLGGSSRRGPNQEEAVYGEGGFESKPLRNMTRRTSKFHLRLLD